jgi:polar amino acid transport system substrate-binding protein
MRIIRPGLRASAVGAAAITMALLGAGCGSSSKSSSTATTAAPAAPPTTLSAMQVPAKYQSGLTVASDATYPPDEFIQNGQIVGFDIDLMKAIGQELHVPIHAVNATFATIIPGLLDGKFDVGNSSFTDNKTREQQVDFVTYYSAGEGYYVKSTSTLNLNGLSALCGHSVAVESGTTEQTDAESQAKKCHVDVLTFSDQNQANLAVSSGRADVGFLDSQVAAYVVHLSNGEFKLTGTPFSTAPYGFALPKNSGLAIPFLAAVKALMANGTYTHILDQWGVQAGAITNPQINGAIS